MMKGMNEKINGIKGKMSPAVFEVEFLKYKALVLNRATNLVAEEVLNYDRFKDRITNLEEFYIITAKVPHKIRCIHRGVGERVNIEENTNTIFNAWPCRLWFVPKFTVPKEVKEKVRKMLKIVPITFNSVKVGEHLFELEFPDVNIWKVENKIKKDDNSVDIYLKYGTMTKFILNIPENQLSNQLIKSGRIWGGTLFATTPGEIIKALNDGPCKSLDDSKKYLNQKRYYQLEEKKK